MARRTRLTAAPVVPDLTAQILAAVPAAPAAGRGRLGQLRGTLALAGIVQSVLAVTVISAALGTGEHLDRELGVFELALAVGFLTVARWPRHAAGLLPVVAVVAVVGLVSGLATVWGGQANVAIEFASHGVELVGAAVMATIVRHTGVPSLALASR